jgi:hypothetical protein
MKTIEVTVGPSGEIKIETKGFTGESCREASKIVEQSLGAKISDTLTSECFAAISDQLQQRSESN